MFAIRILERLNTNHPPPARPGPAETATVCATNYLAIEFITQPLKIAGGYWTN